ncbi:MAG: GrpB family protein [Roseibium sp.]|nr:GrpB family protein [Roseibium sp.]
MPIDLVHYDPAWPAHFAQIKAALEHHLDTLARHIDHVGSTAVPGLDAKPKIHVDVTLYSAAHTDRAVGRLVSVGYTALGPLYGAGDYHLTLPGGTASVNAVNAALPIGHRVVLCGPDARGPGDRARFRDLLRAEDQLAREYAALKRDLARLHGPADNWTGYNDGKSAFITAALAQTRPGIA